MMCTPIEHRRPWAHPTQHPNRNGNSFNSILRETDFLVFLKIRKISKIFQSFSFWATACITVRPILSVRCLSVCLSCLSVSLVYCGQTVGRIKTTLDTQVGLGPGHTVLDGDPPPPPLKGHSPPIFGPYLLRPNGCMDQDATRHGARPRPRRLCVRWGPAPLSKKGVEPPIFGLCLLCQNGWMDQDGT